jgi:HK97 family phage prohead protease
MRDRTNLPEEVRARLDANHVDLEVERLAVTRGAELLECRVLAGKLEVRKNAEGAFGLTGYASVTDVAYPVMGGSSSAYGWDETITSGAFAKALQERDNTFLLINHDSDTAAGIPLASTKSGTLALVEDDIGLLWDAPSLDVARNDVFNLRSATEQEVMDACSFAFRVTRQEWNDDKTERTIREVRLYDVSVVVYPANPAASFVPRSAEPKVQASSGLDVSYAAAVAASLRHKRIPA